MTKYGDPIHRVKHHLWAGIVLLGLACFVPAMMGVPDPERLFYGAVGIIVFGWLAIMAAGETTGMRKHPFHVRRVMIHVIVIFWLVVASVVLGKLIGAEWANRLYVLSAISLGVPVFTIFDHLRTANRERRAMSESRLLTHHPA